MNFKILLFCFSLLFTSALISQVNTDSTEIEGKPYFKVTKNDKSEYIGQILKDDGREILLRTKTIGDLYISKSDIKSIKPIDEMEATLSGNYRERGPFKTRYYFTNNALRGEKGDNYGMVHLYGPEVHFSVSDRLSVGVMATWLASPVGLALKYAVPTKNEKLNFSLGTIMLSSGYLNQARGFGGLHWGSVTYGEAGKNMTLNSGVGYIDLGFRGDFNSPGSYFKLASVSGLGGIFPIGEKASFIFDSMIAISERRNYFTNGYGFTDENGNIIATPSIYNSGTEVTSFFMPGMRFQSSDRRAFQVALAGVIQYSSIGFNYGSNGSDSRSFPVPMCSWFFKL
ncbi:MAG: hypothetical protein AB8B72_04735 [Crocinitomicaceae bacterium]